MVFGLSITEQTSLSQQSEVQNRFRQFILVGTSSTNTTDRNKLIQIRDLADFSNKFGANSLSLPYVRFIFANDPTGQNRYYFVNGYDAAGVKQSLLAGITAIGAELDLEPSVIIIPEAFTIAAQADRTEVYTAAQTLAATKGHLHFFNTATATSTKVAAIAERASYQSASGHSSLYYEFYSDTLAAAIPVALHAAVIEVVRSVNENAFEPPSGISYPALGITGMRNNNIVKDEADYNDLQNNGINIATLIPRGKYCVWGSRTLATDTRWLNINTRVAATLTVERLKAAMLPFLQTSSDPRGVRGREAERRAVAVMDYIFDNGGLTSDDDGDRASAYKVTLRTVTGAGSKRIAQITVQARFVEALEQIQVFLINTAIIV